MALNSAIYGLLLCVFAPFASLRETTLRESRLLGFHTVSAVGGISDFEAKLPGSCS